MNDENKIVKSLEKMLEMLPEELNDEEKKKVKEIKAMLEKLDKKSIDSPER